MPSKVFNIILQRRIENFIYSFVEDSTSIFYKDSKLIHPGEFGKYREQSLKELIQILINSSFKISDGFILSSNDEVSTQCDIVIYNNDDLPILEYDMAQFFTVESVLGIGEIKSSLSFNQFKTALRKLAKNKMISESIKNNSNFKSEPQEYIDLFSFLVCRNMSFDYKNLNFTEIYDGIDQRFWHNFILSIENGFFTYLLNFNVYDEDAKNLVQSRGGNFNAHFSWPYPLHTMKRAYQLQPVLEPVEMDRKSLHIIKFIQSLAQAADRKIKFKSDLVHYAGLSHQNAFGN